MTTRTRSPWDYVGNYGRTWRPGVLAEQLPAFEAAGGVVRPAASGSGLLWAVLPEGDVRPVVCGAIVEVPTEDGPISGRCGADATNDGECEGHGSERDEWLSMTELERLAWERRQEQYA